jgi:hypothetical protein
MKISSLARYAFGIAAGAALLAGCSAAGTQSSLAGAPPASAMAAGGHHLSPQILKHLSMTRADHQTPPAARNVRIKSWMKQVPAAHPLLYVSDDGYYPNVVDVFDYTTGSMVGQASMPNTAANLYGQCSDKHGNVYVVDFAYGYAYEIQHRTTTVINQWYTNGEPIGCSVNGAGDVAISNFYDFGSPSGTGGVVVFPGGGPSGTDYPAPGYIWAAGYDKTGTELVAECNYAGSCTSPGIAKLVGGTWTQLSYNQTIYFPNSVELMGKKFGAGDQEGGGVFNTDIYATTVSGSSASASSTTTLTDSACGYNDSVGWANVSRKPNGVQHKKVKGVVGANLFCGDIDKWAFPAGGNPTGNITGAAFPYGVTLIK